MAQDRVLNFINRSMNLEDHGLAMIMLPLGSLSLSLSLSLYIYIYEIDITSFTMAQDARGEALPFASEQAVAGQPRRLLLRIPLEGHGLLKGSAHRTPLGGLPRQAAESLRRELRGTAAGAPLAAPAGRGGAAGPCWGAGRLARVHHGRRDALAAGASTHRLRNKPF